MMPVHTVEYAIHGKLDVAVLRVGSSRLGAWWSFGDLCAPHWRLYRNDRAGARLRLSGRRDFTLPAGRRCLVPPWLHFAVASESGVRHDFIHLELIGIPAPTQTACFPGPLVLPEDASAERRLVALGDAVRSAAPDVRVVLEAKALGAQAFAEVTDLLPRALRDRLGGAIAGTHGLSPVLKLLDGEPQVRHGNAALGRLVGIGADQLVRRFREQLGTTPDAYRRDRALAIAARALVYGDDGIDAIAERCGYADRQTFSRAFTLRFGVPPARYRADQGAVGA